MEFFSHTSNLQISCDEFAILKLIIAQKAWCILTELYFRFHYRLLQSFCAVFMVSLEPFHEASNLLVSCFWKTHVHTNSDICIRRIAFIRCWHTHGLLTNARHVCLNFLTPVDLLECCDSYILLICFVRRTSALYYTKKS